MGKKGISLIELVAAVALVTIVVASMSLFLPKATRSAVYAGYRVTAKNIAAARMQQIQHLPYGSIPPTAFIAAPFISNSIIIGNGGATPGGCDCSTLTPATMPPDNIGNSNVPSVFPQVINGITYTPRLCVNMVSMVAGVGWISNCVDAPPTLATDTGLKNIRVVVTWSEGSQGGPVNQSIDLTSSVSR